jgi:DNA-binding transcriptional LysR family regulator
MGYELELRDLKYFETIAELGHLGKAALRLNRSQPALTSCVHRLEDTFGTPLFKRVGRGIQLTPAGDALLARARSLRVSAAEAIREMDEIAHGNAGQVRIGAAPTMAQLFLPVALRVFLAEAKHVKLTTMIAQSDLLKASLRAGHLDIVISVDATIEDDLVSQTILEDLVVVAASSSHEVFRKHPLSIKDLAAYEWVLAAPSVESRQWLDQAFSSRGLPAPSARIETNLVMALPKLIAQTDLLCFISRRHLSSAHSGRRLREVPLKETTMRRWGKVIYRKDSHLPPAAQRLLELLCARGRTLFEENS